MKDTYKACPVCRFCWRVGSMYYSFKYHDGVVSTTDCPECGGPAVTIDELAFSLYIDACHENDFCGGTHMSDVLDHIIKKVSL